MTGTPKGAELTHDNLLRNVAAAVDVFGLDERAVTLGALPLFHAFGQTCALNATVAVGGMFTLIARFDGATALEVVERDHVTVFEGVPTMYSAMLHSPRAAGTDASALRVCVSRGAAMPVDLVHAFDARFGCQVLEGYGLSETSPVASFNHRDGERKAGSIGLPLDGVEMRVVDEEGAAVARGDVGEIAIRGHNVMKGYWRRPDATAGPRRRRLVPDRRHGPGRRGRLLLRRRPQEAARHPWRLQRLPARGRGGALRAPRRPRGRGRRHSP